MITVTKFFGDAEYPCALTDPMILELERLTGVGIGVLYRRAVTMQFDLEDLTETIRLGLIGGGMTPQKAAQLVETYARNRPLAETYPLALDLLDARWNGAEAQENPAHV
ncbi:gene transfer agent family protein [Mameliella sp. AT18]|uniref:gene transfer agent family protein n=1 Tax=Mameliella sp. AT18 TaxID=3028385 RepID=UPI00237A5FC0|nr:gene transfer agent family protein [Mameliella sp. AT18]MDD9730457.1 gene transfer agent family protein [Mameliella sp. AT18]